MTNQDQVKKIRERIDALRRYLDIDVKIIKVKEEEKKTEISGFWDNPKEAEKQLKSISLLKKWIDSYEKTKQNIEDLEILFEFFEEGESTENEVDEQYLKSLSLIENLESKNMLRREEDELGAIVKINSGAGGTESLDWAEMLMRMYIKYGEKNNFTVKELAYQAGDGAGIKSVTLEFSGDYAYGFLKSENGVHRLVRISPFNAQGKRQTTFASVFVAPVIDDSIEIEVNPGELSWDTFRSGGAGGQGVNKLETGVRLRHAPSGLIVENTETRSQHRNKENAIRILKSHLYELELRKKLEKQSEIENSKMKIEWGSQIRSYVLHPYKMVKDLRTNHQTGNVQAVLDGDINEFIKKYLMEFGGK